MTTSIREMRENRAALVAQSRAILDTANAEGRDLSGEETATFDRLFGEIEGLGKRIERDERVAALEAEMASVVDARRPERPAPANDVMAQFRAWLRAPRAPDGPAAEFRSLAQNVSVDGGYLVAPQQFVADLIREIDDAVFIRGMATRYTLTGAHSLGIPTRTARVSDFDWTTELQTGAEDTQLGFGKREMKPYPLAKRIKISKTLLRNAALPVDTIVRNEMSYTYGVTMEKAYLTGHGNQQPLGVFTPSNDGIPTSRDVSTGNTTTAIGADNLFEVKYALKAQYQRSAAWMFHRDAVKAIAKLKDNEGQYLWSTSLRDGEPDTLLGRPVYMSEFVPNTFTTGKYVGIFGDFRNYWIVDSLGLDMQPLMELYAETNQMGLITRYEGDGAPVLAEAFARVKLA